MPFSKPYDNVLKMNFNFFFKKDDEIIPDESKTYRVNTVYNTGDKSMDSLLNGDKYFNTFLSKYSKNMKFFIQSSYSYICIDEKKKILFKFFDSGNKNSLNSFLIERKINCFLKKNDFTGVPKMIADYQDVNTKKFVIVQEYKGLDGIELLCRKKLSNIQMIAMIQQIPSLLQEIHSKELYHLDIKLENMCYDDGKWYLVDWGLSKRKGEKIKNLIGTLPYISPSMLSINEVKNLCVFDYYAFALTVMDVYVRLYDDFCDLCVREEEQCSKCKKRTDKNDKSNVKLNIDLIVQIATVTDKCFPRQENFIKKCLRQLARVALSQLNVKYMYAIWKRASFTFEYFQENCVNINPPLEDTVGEWKQFLTIVNTEKIQY